MRARSWQSRAFLHTHLGIHVVPCGPCGSCHDISRHLTCQPRLSSSSTYSTSCPSPLGAPHHTSARLLHQLETDSTCFASTLSLQRFLHEVLRSLTCIRSFSSALRYVHFVVANLNSRVTKAACAMYGVTTPNSSAVQPASSTDLEEHSKNKNLLR